MAKRQRREFAAGFCQQAEHSSDQQERPPFGLLYGPYQVRIATEASPLTVGAEPLLPLHCGQVPVEGLMLLRTVCHQMPSLSLPFVPLRQGLSRSLQLALWGFCCCRCCCFILCVMSILPVCIYVCCIWTWFSQRPGIKIRC